MATSSTKDRAISILKGHDILSYFDEFVFSEDVTLSKPNPEVFLKACEKINVSTNEAIVLEDSEAGIQAAHNAHISVICIPDMKYPDEDYANKTTCILDSLHQVIDYIDNL